MFRTKTTGLNLPGRAFPTFQRDFQRVWMRKTTDAPHNGSVVRTDRVCFRSSTTCSSIHLGTSHGRVDWCQTSCIIFICRERLTQSSCTPNICFLERPPSPEAVFFITLHQPASHGASSHHNAPCCSRSTAIIYEILAQRFALCSINIFLASLFQQLVAFCSLSGEPFSLSPLIKTWDPSL